MKATDLLLNQHRELEQLFDQLEGVDPNDKHAVREELAQFLVGHSVIEKEIFYPALKGALMEEIDEAYEEHAVVEYALARLLSARPNDETFHAKVTLLRELVSHHVQEEERDVLKRAEGALGDAQLMELGIAMESRFEQAKRGYEMFLYQALSENMPKSFGRAATNAKKTTRRAPAKKTRATRATPATKAPKRTPAQSVTSRGAKEVGRATKAKRGAAAGTGTRSKKTASRTGQRSSR